MHVPQTKVFPWLTGSVNKTRLKPRLAAAANTYTSDFPWRKIPRSSSWTISEKSVCSSIWTNPDWAQKLISSSKSRHLLTRNCRHATFRTNPCTHFWVLLLTDRQTNTGKNNTSFVGGKQELISRLDSRTLCLQRTGPFKPDTHWRQSWIRHGRLFVSLAPQHWRQSRKDVQYSGDWTELATVLTATSCRIQVVVDLLPNWQQSRPYRQQSWPHMATVDFVADLSPVSATIHFQRSQPCWIQLCRWCVPGFTLQ